MGLAQEKSINFLPKTSISVIGYITFLFLLSPTFSMYILDLLKMTIYPGVVAHSVLRPRCLGSSLTRTMMIERLSLSISVDNILLT